MHKRRKSQQAVRERTTTAKERVQNAIADKAISILNSTHYGSNRGYGNYGASQIKKSMRGWIFTGGSHKEDIEDNVSILRQRSRDEFMGVPLATGAIKTMRTNVVGVGLKMTSNIDREVLGMDKEAADQLQRDIEREFAVWAESKDCDLQRLDDFYELQQLAFMNWLLSGDVLITLPTATRVNCPYDTRVNLIEADRLQTPPEKENDPAVIEGVECDGKGEVIAYHICNIHPLAYEQRELRKWTRVQAYGSRTGRPNVLHLLTRERIGQRRGVPFLAPVIESLKQLGRYTEAELMAAVISGMYAIFIEKEAATDGEVFGTLDDGPEDAPPDKQPDEINVKNGSIIDLAPGEKANVVQPGRPNTNFGGFVEALSQQVGAALEIPYEVLMKHFSASYSASRGALLEFWKTIDMYRGWMVKDFCQPIFEVILSEMVMSGRIAAPGFFTDPRIRRAYSRAEWHGPSNGQLNPVQEAQAAAIRVQNGFSSRKKEAAEMTGTNFTTNVERLKTENAALSECNPIQVTPIAGNDDSKKKEDKKTDEQ